MNLETLIEKCDPHRVLAHDEAFLDLIISAQKTLQLHDRDPARQRTYDPTLEIRPRYALTKSSLEPLQHSRKRSLPILSSHNGAGLRVER